MCAYTFISTKELQNVYIDNDDADDADDDDDDNDNDNMVMMKSLCIRKAIIK